MDQLPFAECLPHRKSSPLRIARQRKLAGIASTAALVAVSAAVGVLAQTTVQQLPMGNLVVALIASVAVVGLAVVSVVGRFVSRASPDKLREL